MFSLRLLTTSFYLQMPMRTSKNYKEIKNESS